MADLTQSRENYLTALLSLPNRPVAPSKEHISCAQLALNMGHLGTPCLLNKHCCSACLHHLHLQKTKEAIKMGCRPGELLLSQSRYMRLKSCIISKAAFAPCAKQLVASLTRTGFLQPITLREMLCAAPSCNMSPAGP